MLRKITQLFLTLALGAAFTGAHAAIIFDNYNGNSIINQHGSGGIGSGTALDTMFTLSADTFVGELRTYQFGETTFPSVTYYDNWTRQFFVESDGELSRQYRPICELSRLPQSIARRRHLHLP